MKNKLSITALAILFGACAANKKTQSNTMPIIEPVKMQSLYSRFYEVTKEGDTLMSGAKIGFFQISKDRDTTYFDKSANPHTTLMWNQYERKILRNSEENYVYLIQEDPNCQYNGMVVNEISKTFSLVYSKTPHKPELYIYNASEHPDIASPSTGIRVVLNKQLHDNELRFPEHWQGPPDLQSFKDELIKFILDADPQLKQAWSVPHEQANLNQN